MVSRASAETSVNRRPSSVRNEMPEEFRANGGSLEPMVETYVRPGEMSILMFPGCGMFCCTAWSPGLAETVVQVSASVLTTVTSHVIALPAIINNHGAQ